MDMDSVFFIACFLPICLTLYWLIPGVRGKNTVLLLMSLLFYTFAGWSALAVLAVSCLVNFLLGLTLRGRHKKRFLTIGIAWNVLVLCLYKYLGLFGLQLGLMAPLGISFFTFKCISYLVDGYRDGENVTDSLPDFALYVCFFPQIAMGPITRFSEFAPQLRQRQTSLQNTAEGLRRFVVGLGKKLVISAPLGVVVDRIFAQEVSALDARLAWLAALCYCLQLYFDFSGCIDMAIGLGKAFGFSTRENFSAPYTAVSVGDFWRRWHMSLSAWFKDYVYIPLGGNRLGKLRAGINKCIVFALCGIWHGANWTFLLWGFWHGLFSLMESVNIIPARKMAESRVGRILGRVYTLLVVCLGFVMFRAGSVAQGFAMLGVMFSGFGFAAQATVLLKSLLTGQVILMLVLGVLLSMPVGKYVMSRYGRVLEPVSYVLALVLLVLCIVKLASGNFAPSIYAQF